MFNKSSRQHKCKLNNNSGSTMLIVMVAIALIAVLATVLMSMSYMNYNMKVTEYQSKKNFYSAEVVLDQINVGLQKEMSESLEEAYIRSMQRYTLDDDIARNANFGNYYISELTKRLRKNTLDSQYQIAPIDTDGDGVNDCGLVHYLDSSLQAAYLNGDLVIDSLEPKMESVAVARTNSSGAIEYEAQGLILYNLYISYTDASDYTTVIETDIRLKTPSLTLVTKTAMPNVFDYCMVADAGILGGTTGLTSTIEGSVYAGNDTGSTTDVGGILCVTAHDWTFTGESRIVSAGPLRVNSNAKMTVDEDVNCWAESIILNKSGGSANSGKLNLLGQTYVKDDLTIEGKGAEVTIAGDYYGFGYGSEADESSAIILNGKGAKLDMSGLERLMLGGNAYIQTSKVTYTVDATKGYTSGNNKDVLMGNALAVKSDQIAYLVPAECIGVKGNQVLIGKNPMNSQEYQNWKNYASLYTDYEKVSLTKEVKILGKSLDSYELNTPAYKTVFRTVNGDTLCYLYLDLTQNGADDYYKEYYNAAQTRMDNYIKTYNNKIIMNTDNLDQLSTRGTLLTYSEDGEIALVENTINDATTTAELAAIENDYTVDAQRYERLKAKLTTEDGEVTAEELSKTVYENLINESVMNSLPNNKTGKTYTFNFTSIDLTTKAVFVNNKGKGAYIYNDEDVCVIVATGDVKLTKNFDGLLITDGKIYIESGATKIEPNKEQVLKTLGQMESSGADAMSLIAKYFKNGDKYSMETKLSGEVTNSMAGQSMGELIIYENWAKQ